MGFRFRKSINIIPDVRLNLSSGAPSLSAGPRGASVSFGSRGTYANLGLPGTGLSYRTQLSRAAHSGGRSQTATDPGLRQALEQEAAELISAITAIRNIHELTPDLRTGISWAELGTVYLHDRTSLFQVLAPVHPEKPDYLTLPEKSAESEGISFLGKQFESESAGAERHTENLRRWQQELIDAEHENTFRQHRYQQQRTAWAEQYINWKFEAEEHEKRLTTAQADARWQFRINTAFFESYLANVLAGTEWPHETLAAFGVEPELSAVLLDVDLAEIEDFPGEIYGANTRGTGLTEKTMAQKAVRENYAYHVRGCLFCLVGIVLHALPFDNVIVSGFTQRISKRTGYLEDEYILSCKCIRSQMSSINFEGIEHIDPAEALGDHPVTRKMNNTFIFQPIEPLTL